MRVMTWNVWWRFGDWRSREDAIIDVLVREQPDVIGLQEVWTDGHDDQARRLAQRLGMHWVVAPAPDARRWSSRGQHDDVGVGVGNAVLSRWPLTAVDVVDLPAAGARGVERTLLVADIDTPSGPLLVATTHLHSDLDGGALRLQQAGEVVDRLLGTDETKTVVLTGDLNGDPGSAEVRRLLSPPLGAVAGRCFVDAWEASPGGEPGWTWDVRNPHAAAHGPEGARVDYVLVSRPSPGRRTRSSARVVGCEPVAGTWPSDHCAVVVDVDVDDDREE